MSAIRNGLFISDEDLFDNTLYTLLTFYWIHFHHLHRCYFWCLKNYLPKVKKMIGMKWVKCLPKNEIVLQKMEEKDERFNPLGFEENSEGYFEKLMIFKEKEERYHLREQFIPKRQS